MPLRFVIAPDSFKESLSAVQAAQAMQRLGAKTIFISITHSKDVAAAVAILEA